MRSYFKPSFYLGIISHLILFLGIALKSFEYKYSNYIILGSFVLGFIYWVWSIMQLVNDANLDKSQKTFWSIIVISVPMFGAMIYQIMQVRRGRTAA